MKGPSLQRTTALSAAFHLTIFLLSLIVIKQSNRIVMPSPYTVQLVAPTDKLLSGKTKALNSYRKLSRKKVSSSKSVKPVLSREKNVEKSRIIKENRIDDRITELEAKKRIERIVRLRSIISLKGAEKPTDQPAPVQTTGEGSAKETLFDSYYAKITAEIWQEWIFPDTGVKDLETIIFVKILRDGTIKVQRVEKSSSNILFDRSALKALAKASPVSLPPYEMEIGIRFYP